MPPASRHERRRIGGLLFGGPPCCWFPFDLKFAQAVGAGLTCCAMAPWRPGRRRASRGHAAVTGAEPELGFPRDIAHLFREALLAFQQGGGDPGLQAVARIPAWAASTITRRASPLPLLVMPPRRRFSPEECSEGTGPR